LDHLFAMPLTPCKIAMSKIWASGLISTLAVGLSLYLVVRAILDVPIAGSIPLFMVGVLIYLFFRHRDRHFSGHRDELDAAAWPFVHAGFTADEHAVGQQHAAGEHAALAWHCHAGFPIHVFVSFTQYILYRDAGLSVIWPQFLVVAVLAALFLALARWRFRSVVAQTN
jgi:ABC-2 type transport system permease protein